MPSGLDALREERRRFTEELAVLRSNANTTRGSVGSAELEDSADPDQDETERSILQSPMSGKHDQAGSASLGSQDLQRASAAPENAESTARLSAVLSITANPIPAHKGTTSKPGQIDEPPKDPRNIAAASNSPRGASGDESAQQVLDCVSDFLQAKRMGTEKADAEDALQAALSGLANINTADGTEPRFSGLGAARSYLEEVTNMLYGREIAASPPEPQKAENPEHEATATAQTSSPDREGLVPPEKAFSSAAIRSEARDELGAHSDPIANPPDAKEGGKKEGLGQLQLAVAATSPRQTEPEATVYQTHHSDAIHSSLEMLGGSAKQAGRERLDALIGEWTPPRHRPQGHHSKNGWAEDLLRPAHPHERFPPQAIPTIPGGLGPASTRLEGDGSPSPRPRSLPARLFAGATPASGTASAQAPAPCPPPCLQPQPQEWVPAVQPWWPGPQVPPGVAWMPCWAPWGLATQGPERQPQPQLRVPAGPWRDVPAPQPRSASAADSCGDFVGNGKPEEAANGGPPGKGHGVSRRQKLTQHLEGIKQSFWELASQAANHPAAMPPVNGAEESQQPRMHSEGFEAADRQPSHPQGTSKPAPSEDFPCSSSSPGKARVRSAEAQRQMRLPGGQVATPEPKSPDGQQAEQNHSTLTVQPQKRMPIAAPSLLAQGPPPDPKLPLQMQQTFARAYCQLHRENLLMPAEIVPLPEPELHRVAKTAAARALGGRYDYSATLADLEELHLAAEDLAKETKIEAQQRKQESNLVAVYSKGPALDDDVTFEDANALQQAVSQEVETRIAAALQARAKPSTKERYAAHTASWRAARRGATEASADLGQSPHVRASRPPHGHRDRSRSPLRGLHARDPLPAVAKRAGPTRIPRPVQQHQPGTEAEEVAEKNQGGASRPVHRQTASANKRGQGRIHVAFGTRVKAPAPLVESPPSLKPTSRAPRKAPHGFVPRVASLGQGGPGARLETISEEPGVVAPASLPPLLRPSARRVAREAIAQKRADFLQQVAKAAGLVPPDLANLAPKRRRPARPRPSAVPASAGLSRSGSSMADDVAVGQSAYEGIPASIIDEQFIQDIIDGVVSALKDNAQNKKVPENPTGGAASNGAAAAAAAAILARALDDAGSGGLPGNARAKGKASSSPDTATAASGGDMGKTAGPVPPQRNVKQPQAVQEEFTEQQRGQMIFEREIDVVAKMPVVEEPEEDEDWRTGPQGEPERTQESEEAADDPEPQQTSDESVANSVEDWVASRVAAEMLVKQIQQDGKTGAGSSSKEEAATSQGSNQVEWISKVASAASLSVDGAKNMDPNVRELLTYEVIAEIVGEVIRGSGLDTEVEAVAPTTTGLRNDRNMASVEPSAAALQGGGNSGDIDEAVVQLVLGVMASAQGEHDDVSDALCDDTSGTQSRPNNANNEAGKEVSTYEAAKPEAVEIQPHRNQSNAKEIERMSGATAMGGKARSSPAASMGDKSDAASEHEYSNSFEQDGEDAIGAVELEGIQAGDLKRRVAVKTALSRPDLPPRVQSTTPVLLPSQSPHFPPARPPPALQVAESLDYALTDDDDENAEARPESPATPTTPDVSSSLMELANIPALEFGLIEGLGIAHRGAVEAASANDSQALAQAAEVAPPPATAISRPPTLPDVQTQRLWRPEGSRPGVGGYLTRQSTTSSSETGHESSSTSEDSAQAGSMESRDSVSATPEQRLAELADRRRALMNKAGLAGKDESLLTGDSNELSEVSGAGDGDSGSVSQSTDHLDLSKSDEMPIGMWLPGSKHADQNMSSEYAPSDISLSSSSTGLSR